MYVYMYMYRCTCMADIENLYIIIHVLYSSLCGQPLIVLVGQRSGPHLLSKPVHVSAKLLDCRDGLIHLKTQLAHLTSHTQKFIATSSN